MADDGGVQAAVDSAKAALTGAAHSNVSPAKSPFAPPKPPSAPPKPPSYSAPHGARIQSGAHTPPAPKPGIGGEVESAAAGLSEKQKNVDAYKAANP